MQLTNSLVTIFATIGISTQHVEGKPQERTSGLDCSPEVEVHAFPEHFGWTPNGRYQLRIGINQTEATANGHGIYENMNFDCIWWYDETTPGVNLDQTKRWQIGSCDSVPYGGIYYLTPTEVMCPYGGIQGQWKKEMRNDTITGYVTAIQPPTNPILDVAGTVLHHVLGAMVPQLPIFG